MKWLHISDLHFGYNAATITNMRDKLLKLAESFRPIDCLFITGDLRYGKTERESYPENILPFIQRLQNALGVTPENTFVVPGNHDVNRSSELKSLIQAAAEEYTTPDGSISEETLNYITRRRQPFLELYQKICGRDEPSGWHYCIEKDEFNIICLNSALFCCQDGEDGNLVIGAELLNRLRYSENFDVNRPAIVLAHHDFDSFREEERQNLEIALKDMGAILYLCGHKHVARSRLQNSYRAEQNLYVFLCGTSMDKDPQLTQTDMDFFIGEIDTKGQGYVKAYKWSPRRADWLPDQEFSHAQGRNIDGIQYFPAETRPIPITAATMDQKVLQNYRQYIRSQCSEIELNGMPTNLEDIKRTYELNKIFVPLSFIRADNSDENLAIDKSFDLIRASEQPKISLSELMPDEGCFRQLILADPGAGKTTLLKWIASAFCFPDEFMREETYQSERKLFPIWIRCRDIKDGVYSVWDAISDIARLGEWIPDGLDAKVFISHVLYHIQNETALLLIDGLDEIGNENNREHFVDQIKKFINQYPTTNVIVTSRVKGFSIISSNAFSDFERFEIAPLSEKGIVSLCAKWYEIVYGKKEKVRETAKQLANKIIENERLKRLANNPLMLTTLLLVKRRVGRLPTKRAALYHEAIQVLLETWNSAWRGNERIDLDEARYQLAYIAFYMMTGHKKKITRTELTDLLLAVRHDFSNLVPSGNRETVSEFINKIERRSALLIQKGLEKTQSGNIEAVYEFQHLTFQEYLAAYAVQKCCYAGASRDNRDGIILSPYLADSNMKEVIALVAAMDAFCASSLTEEIIKKMTDKSNSLAVHQRLRTLLLQFVVDEVSLKTEEIHRIFEVCLGPVLWGSDIQLFYQILDGTYAQLLKNHFAESDMKKHNGYDYSSSILAIISNEIDNPYQYYLENRNVASDKQKSKAFSVLANALWLDRSIWNKLNETEREDIKHHTLIHLKDSNHHIQRNALEIISMADFVKLPQELSQYITAFVDNVNKTERVPDIISVDIFQNSGCTQIVESQIRLTDRAFACICKEIKLRAPLSSFTYLKLLTLSLVTCICCTDQQPIDKFFSALYNERVKMGFGLFGLGEATEEKILNTLKDIVLQTPSSLESTKKALSGYVSKINLAQKRYQEELHQKISKLGINLSE